MQLFRIKSFIFLFLLSFLSSALAERKFVSLGGYGGSDVAVKILEQDQYHTRIAISFSGFYEETVTYQGKQGKVISTSGMFRIPCAGVPDIPHMNRVIQVPEKAIVSFNVVEKKQKIFSNIDIAPSRRPLAISDDPDTIPRIEGDIYAINKKFPEELFGMVSTGIMRDVRTLKYFFSAFQYNPVTDELTVTSRIVVDFLYDQETEDTTNAGVGGTNLILDSSCHASSTFKHMYDMLLPNYAPEELNGSEPCYDDESNMNGKEGILFCVGAALDGEVVDSFIDYKSSKFDVYKCTFAFDSITPDSIRWGIVKDTITRYYSDYNITYVIIVGDVEHVPTYVIPYILGDSSNSGVSEFNWARVPTDQWYSVIDSGNLQYDVIVSRFSAKNSFDLQRQFYKVRTYENASSTAAWIKRGFMAASNDRVDLGHGIANAMKYHSQFDTNGIIFHTGPDSDTLFKAKIYDIFNNIDSNVNIFAHVGHGEQEKLLLGFKLNDITGLQNTENFPLMYIIACFIGDFKYHEVYDCFSEGLMNAKDTSDTLRPTGCASIFSSTIKLPEESEPALRSAFTDKFYNEKFVSYGEFCMVTKQLCVNWLIENPGMGIQRSNLFPIDSIVFLSMNLLGDCSMEMKVGDSIQQDYTMSDFETDTVKGPILFTAPGNIEIGNCTINPSLVMTPGNYYGIIHDFEALARKKITLLPGFTVNYGARVHIAIDDDLLIIPPWPVNN